MKTILVMALLLVTAGAANAQLTVSPVIVECGHKCASEFTLTNDALSPIVFSIESRSFSIVNGSVVLRPLDANVKVTVSQYSGRLGPKEQKHAISYKVVCSTYPCAVQIFVMAVVGRTESGLQAKVGLPEVIYACDRPKGCRDLVRGTTN
jgi:hypothetical protein